jgi:hypothetical protein
MKTINFKWQFIAAQSEKPEFVQWSYKNIINERETRVIDGYKIPEKPLETAAEEEKLRGFLEGVITEVPPFSNKLFVKVGDFIVTEKGVGKIKGYLLFSKKILCVFAQNEEVELDFGLFAEHVKNGSYAIAKSREEAKQITMNV